MPLRNFIRNFRDVQKPSGQRDLSGQPGTAPLFRDGRAPTVLALHGFTGTPNEVAICVDVASELGLRTRAPLLPGHGTNAGDLAKYRFEDWLEAAAAVFDEERARGPVILAGLSLGSLLSTELVLRAPGDVSGLVLMANAFSLMRPHPDLGLAVVERLGISDFFQPKSGPDLGDPEARRTHLTYNAQPMHAALSLRRAGRRLREELFRVHRPTLILHGAEDRVCPVKNAWSVAAALGTSDVRTVILPRSHHILTRDVERAKVAMELNQFFRRVS